ncbi:MAG: hypothetical protein ABIV51_13835, partial [Saprospiraceae bacterium]
MGVRKEEIELDLRIVSKDQVQFNKLLKDSAKLNQELRAADGNAAHFQQVLNRIETNSKAFSKIDIESLSKNDLVNRAEHLNKALGFIGQNRPQFEVINTELKSINVRLKLIRESSYGSSKTTVDGFSGVSTGLKIVNLAAGVLGGIIASFSIGALITAGKELLKSATALSQIGRQTKSVFGEASKQVEEFAARNAAAQGLTQSAYLKSTNAIGGMLKNMGFQIKDTVTISTQVQNLSGVLAEWSNGQEDAASTSEILNKALHGEYEGLS